MPPTPIQDLLNMGPKCAEWLHAVKIDTKEDLERIGIIEAYKRVKAKGYQTVNIIFLQAMWGALAECPWDQIPEDIKRQLKEELDK